MRQAEECRTYVNHLRAEHQHLDQDVRGILSSLRAMSAKQAPPGELLRQLTSLRDDLRRHFTEEDAGGCLEEAVSRCPSVAEEVDSLLKQHPALLERLNRLLARIDAEHRELPDGFAVELKQFTGELLAHEGAENQIMRRAFGTLMNGDGDDDEK
jgi:iron-sulfur cluster repair protein YtfE (RIC family)